MVAHNSKSDLPLTHPLTTRLVFQRNFDENLPGKHELYLLAYIVLPACLPGLYVDTVRDLNVFVF